MESTDRPDHWTKRLTNIRNIWPHFCIPAKHRVDRFCEFGTVRFVDATGVHLKVSQAMAPCLFSAEVDLLIANFTLTATFYHVFEGGLLGVCFPCVRKYGIRGDIVAEVLSQAQLAIAIAFQ